jgi:hypothetical protein
MPASVSTLNSLQHRLAVSDGVSVLLRVLQPVLPGWTFQPSALQELWLADPEEEADLDWSARAPQLSPSLVPLVDGEQPGVSSFVLFVSPYIGINWFLDAFGVALDAVVTIPSSEWDQCQLL